MPQEIASVVHDKERRDEAEFAQLVIRGATTVATTTGGQGGMNATYLAALKANGGPGSDIHTASGTIPSYVRPPAELSPGFASVSSVTSPAPRTSQGQVTSVAPTSVGGVKISTADLPPSPPQNTAQPAKAASASGLINGAAPMAPAGSLENGLGSPR